MKVNIDLENLESIIKGTLEKNIETIIQTEIKKIVKEYVESNCEEAIQEIVGEQLKKYIDESTTIEAELVKQGKWIEKPYLFGTTNYCSLCENNYGMPHERYNFCPNCGAKMDLEVEE